ncbi:hypothetical protein GG804_19075 [Sphingomonas histidinilytica]|uniref:hypothetical protein n=1 Tax=Rhizorhabdus histidinilytica TaxID=439228 RepID=UPI001ADC1C89|nr:hypothetical protein [Rhizorhabdus histidinilytica]MBO9378874.1 hypothetical protein [Rhizorhabdus histidinilytica]
MLLKFQIGLFDNPFVDEGKADERVRVPGDRDAGLTAQTASLAVIKDDGVLTRVKNAIRVWIYDLDATQVRQAGFEIVDSRIRRRSQSCVCRRLSTFCIPIIIPPGLRGG